MIQLQRPEWAFFDGKAQPYENAVLHVSTEAVYRGLNVFEGMKGYWQPDGSMGIVAVPRHWERLAQSAKLLHFPLRRDPRKVRLWNARPHRSALCPRARHLGPCDAVHGRGALGEDQRSDLVMTAFHMSKESQKPIRTGVISWRRASDLALPARIKTSTNYQVARLAKVEGRSRGDSDMILLNQHDRVAESLVSCLLMVRDGVVVTPPASEGALESVTVDIVEALARTEGIPFVRRPIERSELYIADEIAFAGTITELTPVESVDGFACSGRTRLLDRLCRQYRAAAMGIVPHPAVDLSIRRYESRAADAKVLEGLRIGVRS
jgi:branched-chain amino acid aminotransferase